MFNRDFRLSLHDATYKVQVWWCWGDEEGQRGINTEA